MEDKKINYGKEKDLSLKTLIALTRCYQSVHKRETRTIKDACVTFSQFAVLELLFHKGDMRVCEITEKVLSTAGNMTVIIENKEDMNMENTKKMPVLFVGHGSPMNAIEDNEFTSNWVKVAEEIPRPKAILSVSAHWYTNGSRINNDHNPKIIYDMYGFPAELYAVKYNAKGSSEFASMTSDLIKKDVKIDNSFGIDHGTWSVLCRMYSQADIPVYQLSIDMNTSAEEHFRIGQEISSLREKGVLILGSGNVVHNLMRINRDMDGGYPWAVEFDEYIKEKVTGRQYEDVIHYDNAGKSSKLAFTTLEHYLPLLYVLGASREDDELTVFNDSCTLGSISMTCYLFK